MNDATSSLLISLLRTTCWLTVAALATTMLLRITRTTTPRVHRIAWVLTLVVGWSFLRVPVAVPLWHAVELPTSERLALATGSESRSDETDSPATDELTDAGNSPTTTSLPLTGNRPAASAVPLTDANIHWPIVVLIAWLFGIVAIMSVWLIGYLRFVRRLPRLQSTNDDWQQQWQAILQAHGINRPIALRVTADHGPMLCRLPRGYELVIPAQLWNTLNEPQRAAILRHELAHYLRGDVWKSLAARILALPHWFNPAAWWAVKKLDEAAEWACDRAAIANEPPSTYAKALLQLGEAASRQTGYGSAIHGRTLAARIRRLLSTQGKEDSRMKKLLLFTVAICVALIAFMRIDLMAKEPPASPKELATETTPPTAAMPSRSSEAQKATDRLVEAARDGYKAVNTAYEADTVTFDQVLAWAKKLLDAQLIAAKNHDQRVAALREYVDHTKTQSELIKRLYENGTRGGELDKYLNAKYHQADAERLLAEEIAKDTSKAEELALEKRHLLAAETHLDRSKKTDTGEWTVSRESLRYDGKSFNEWRTQLQTELRLANRIEAINAFGAFGNRGYGAEAAAAIVEVMGEYPDNSVVDSKIVDAARGAMKNIPALDAEPAFVAALQSKKINQRRFAAAALAFGFSRLKSVIPALLTAAKDEDVRVRRNALAAITQIDPGAPEFTPIAVAALKDEDVNVVTIAGDAIVAIYTAESSKGVQTPRVAEQFVAEFVQLLNHPEPMIRARAAICLGTFREKALPALPILLGWLETKSEFEQQAAFQAIGFMGPAAKEAIPALGKFLSDPSTSVRANAAAALHQIRSEQTPEEVPGAQGTRGRLRE